LLYVTSFNVGQVNPLLVDNDKIVTVCSSTMTALKFLCSVDTGKEVTTGNQAMIVYKT